MVDIGSYTTRAGYAGEDMPKVTLNTLKSELKLIVIELSHPEIITRPIFLLMLALSKNLTTKPSQWTHQPTA